MSSNIVRCISECMSSNIVRCISECIVGSLDPTVYTTHNITSLHQYITLYHITTLLHYYIACRNHTHHSSPNIFTHHYVWSSITMLTYICMYIYVYMYTCARRGWGINLRHAQHHYITTLPHYYITTLLHYYITTLCVGTPHTRRMPDMRRHVLLQPEVRTPHKYKYMYVLLCMHVLLDNTTTSPHDYVTTLLQCV
jgi:hypothetical protein